MLAPIRVSPPYLCDYAAYQERRAREQPVGRDRPDVSVITVCLNAKETIRRAIASVQAQSFGAIEHIIVDGASTDGTLDVVRRLARPQDYLLSETDRGISDAFNKGVACARGRYVQILNADDWLSPEQIARAVAALQKAAADFVFGDLIFYENERPIFRYMGDADYARSIHRRCPSLGHPTVLARRESFERIGLFDLSYRNAMDYDWLLRLHRAGGIGLYCPDVVAHMTHAGVSNRQFARTIDEVRQIVIAHGRSRMVAGIEARARLLKTSAAQPIKRSFHPLYSLVRSMINRSYTPAE